MLKPRYVIIILILTIVFISVAAAFSELILLGNAATTAETYVRIAANAALRSAAMSDEFFTSGTDDEGNYATGIDAINASAYFGGSNIDIATQAAFSRGGLLIGDDAREEGDSFSSDSEANNIYVRTYGDFGDSYANKVNNIYLNMFKNSPMFQQWASNILKFYMERSTDDAIASRRVYWAGMSGDAFHSGFTYIPRIMTMGTSIFDDSDSYANRMDDFAFMTSDGSGSYDEDPSNFGSVSGLVDEIDFVELLKSVDYWDYKRISTAYEERPDIDAFNVMKTAGEYDESTGGLKVDTSDGQLVLSDGQAVFFYTPTSIGLTYVDPYVLNNLFRANMDLLMRSKYLENDVLVNGYTSTPDFSYYPVDAYPTSWENYVVNNGSLFYLRGQYIAPTGAMGAVTTPGHYRGWGGTVLDIPQVEYIYIPVTESNVGTLDSDIGLRTLLTRAIDPTITFENLLTDSTEVEVLPNGDRLYELVIAKVTFTADFMYPYQSASLRGMSRHFNDPTKDAVTETVSGMEVSHQSLNAVLDSFTTIADDVKDKISAGLAEKSNFNDAKAGTDMEYCKYRYTTYFTVRN